MISTSPRIFVCIFLPDGMGTIDDLRAQQDSTPITLMSFKNFRCRGSSTQRFLQSINWRTSNCFKSDSVPNFVKEWHRWTINSGKDLEAPSPWTSDSPSQSASLNCFGLFKPEASTKAGFAHPSELMKLHLFMDKIDKLSGMESPLSVLISQFFLAEKCFNWFSSVIIKLLSPPTSRKRSSHLRINKFFKVEMFGSTVPKWLRDKLNRLQGSSKLICIKSAGLLECS